MSEEGGVDSTGSTGSTDGKGDGKGSSDGRASSGATKPDPVDDLVITRHTLRTKAGELAYTARTGRVVLREEEVENDVFRGWKARAEMSVTAYTLDDGDVTTRPITFVFNGGPGPRRSGSTWACSAHAASTSATSPRRTRRRTDSSTTPRPCSRSPTSSSSTRCPPATRAPSREASPKDFHGFGKDVEQVTELIRLWCTREDRWMSPKYLVGESYGTVRAVAVAERLSSRHSMGLNGIVLISSVLDFGSQDFEFHRIDEACLNFLPTYTSIAHYHGRLKGRLPKLRQEAEAFVAGPYRTALAAGRRLPAKERASVARTLARLTGLSEEYVDRTDLRIEHWRFCTELLRDRGLTVGRIDGRFSGPLHSLIAENMDADPSMDAMEAPFTAALHHYLRSELGSTQDLSYEIFASAIKEWSFKEFEGKPIFVADKLERVMRANPHLRVRIEYGYYDLATPYHAAEDMVAHLRLPEAAFDRIEHAYFETGHMPYLHEPSRKREAAGIAAFVERT